MGIPQDQAAAAAAIHAAKMAQKMAMEHKLPHGFFPPHLDISKITNQESGSKNLNLPNVTIEATSNNAIHKSLNLSGNSGMDIRRNDSDREDHHHHHHQQQQQQQSMMSINNNSSNNNNNINSYNKEESSADERNLSDDESIAVN